MWTPEAIRVKSEKWKVKRGYRTSSPFTLHSSLFTFHFLLFTQSLHIPLLPAPELDSARLHESIILPERPVLLHLGDGVE
jgi:hypothetical protein